MGSDNTLGFAKLLFGQAEVLRQAYLRLKPELGLAARVLNMHVHAWFLAREEKEPEAVFD